MKNTNAEINNRLELKLSIINVTKIPLSKSLNLLAIFNILSSDLGIYFLKIAQGRAARDRRELRKNCCFRTY